MNNVALALISKVISENMDWVLRLYGNDESLLKDFVYSTMSARKNEQDRKLADMLYEQLLKVPEDRRKMTVKLLISDMINYMMNTNKNYFSAIIDVNTNCNMQCNNCANGKLNVNQNTSWSLEEINFVLKKLQPYTRLIYVSGGEPFMNSNLIKAMEQNPELQFLVFTNGSMKKKYQELVTANLLNAFMMVSIDGTKEHHDYKRGDGSFERAVETIQYFRESGFLCGISSIIEEPTIDYILSDDYIKFAESVDASALYLLKDAHNRNEEFKKKYIELSKKMEETSFKRFPAFNVPYSEKTLSPDLSCLAGRQWLRVNANFELTACPFSEKSYGNITKDDMKTMVKTLKKNVEEPQSSC